VPRACDRAIELRGAYGQVTDGPLIDGAAPALGDRADRMSESFRRVDPLEHEDIER